MKKILLTLITLAVLGLAIFACYFAYQKFIKKSSSQVKAEPCAQFSAIKGKITCQEAKETALKNFSGDIVKIEKKKVSYQINKESEVKQANAWVFTLKSSGSVVPGQPVLPDIPPASGKNNGTNNYNNIEVAVDAKQNQILYVKFIDL